MKILFVDKPNANRSLTYLLKMVGHQLTHVHSVFAGLASLLHENFDVVIISIDVPAGFKHSNFSSRRHTTDGIIMINFIDTGFKIGEDVKIFDQGKPAIILLNPELDQTHLNEYGISDRLPNVAVLFNGSVAFHQVDDVLTDINATQQQRRT